MKATQKKVGYYIHVDYPSRRINGDVVGRGGWVGLTRDEFRRARMLLELAHEAGLVEYFELSRKKMNDPASLPGLSYVVAVVDNAKTRTRDLPQTASIIETTSHELFP